MDQDTGRFAVAMTKRYSSDPHQVLGIRRNASDEQVKTAYRNLAKQWHPDVNPEDPEAAERFKEIQWAYEEICDARERLKVPPGFTGAHSAHGFAPPNEHPFFSFAEAVRNYYAGKKES